MRCSLPTAPGTFACRVRRLIHQLSPYRLLANAVVEIRENNQLLHRLIETSPGRYTAPAAPLPDRMYTLHVDAPDFEPVSGASIIPAPPDVSDFDVQQTESNADDEFLLNVSFTITDTPAEKNYYALTIQLEEARYVIDTGELYQHFRTREHFESSDPIFSENTFIDEPGGEYIGLALFTDELFDGRSRKLDLSFDIRDWSQETFTRVERAYSIILLSLTEDMYQILDISGPAGSCERQPVFRAGSDSFQYEQRVWHLRRLPFEGVYV